MRATGPDVHLEHPRHGKDGRVLDPDRSEQLVYAIGGSTATLLGAVFVMEVAGRPGPAPARQKSGRFAGTPSRRG